MGRRPALVSVYLLLTAFALYPVFAATIPPLVDYPNHLARAYILANFETAPLLRANYALGWSIRPNLGVDLVLPHLIKVIGPYGAGRVFIATILFLLVAGTLLLRRVLLGSIGLMPVVMYLFLYNHVLYWGFLNNLLGVSLVLILFSLWIYYRDKINIISFAAFSLSSCLLFFTHFFAFCVYGLCILAFEAWRLARQSGTGDKARRRDFAIGCAQFFPAGVLTLVWLARTAVPGDAGIGFTYGTFDWKILALYSPVVFSATATDLVFAFLLTVLLSVILLTRAVMIAPEARWPLVALCVAAAAMPNNLSGIDMFAGDMRLPLVIALLFVAAARFQFNSRVLPRVLFCIVLGLVAWRVVDVSATWSRKDQEFAEFRTALEHVEAGASMLFVGDREDLPESEKPLGYRQFWNIVSLGVIERSLFTPVQFTGHMSLRASERRRPIDSSVGMVLTRKQLETSVTADNAALTGLYGSTTHIRPYWGRWPETFDYVLVVRFDRVGNPMPQYLSAVASGSYFDIYRVLKPAAPGPVNMPGK